MKVIKTTTDTGETSVTLDLFEGRSLPKKVKAEIQDQVGNYLVEQTLISMGEKKSPIAGEGSYKPLSKDYKKKKIEIVGSGNADLEFDGLMKDELTFVPTENGIEIGVYGERAGAADGHNNLSGNSSLPTRRFLPDKGQSYKKDTVREVERIIADVVAENTTFKKSDFKNIETKKELYDKLKTIFGSNMSRSELNIAVFRNEELTNLFKQLDLMDLL